MGLPMDEKSQPCDLLKPPWALNIIKNGLVSTRQTLCTAAFGLGQPTLYINAPNIGSIKLCVNTKSSGDVFPRLVKQR
jgi:hypothetical protein